MNPQSTFPVVGPKARPVLNHQASPEPLPLPLHPHVPLIKVDTVVAARGQHVEAVASQVERGVLRWVFNVCANPDGPIRELRFWTREICLFAARRHAEHATLRAAGVQSVLNEILGDRQQFRFSDICLLLSVRRSTLSLMRRELHPAGRGAYLRKDLKRFLTRRLLK